MKIESGKQAFEFEEVEPGRPRRIELGVVAALAAVYGGEQSPKDRFGQLELLRQHVSSRCDHADISLDEADGLLDALLELDAAKKKKSAPATSPSSTASTPTT